MTRALHEFSHRLRSVAVCQPLPARRARGIATSSRVAGTGRAALVAAALLAVAHLPTCALPPEEDAAATSALDATKDSGPVFRGPPAAGVTLDAGAPASDGFDTGAAPGSDAASQVLADAAVGGDLLLPGDATASDGGLPAEASPTAGCEPVGSAGCGDGLQCFPDPGGNVCLNPGKKPHGAACAGWNDCAWGHLCIAGVCRTICATTATSQWACKPGVPCEKIVFSGAGAAGKNLGACKSGDACDVLTDQGCASGQTCAPAGWIKACIGTGKAVAGATCTSAADCLPGHLCLDAGGAAVCRKKCSTLGGPQSCVGKCSPLLSPDGQPRAGDVGFCVE